MSTLLKWSGFQTIDLHVSELQSGEFQRGDRWLILGPNGCGKTSWMKSILGFNPQHIRPFEIQWAPHLPISYVPQVSEVFMESPLTVSEFLSLSRQKRIFAKPSFKNKFTSKDQQILQDLGLNSFLQQSLRSLSRGQWQRVLIARALLTQPEVLFLDEPTAGLDIETRHQVLNYLFNHVQSFVIILHDPDWKLWPYTRVIKCHDHSTHLSISLKKASSQQQENQYV